MGKNLVSENRNKYSTGVPPPPCKSAVQGGHRPMMSMVSSPTVAMARCIGFTKGFWLAFSLRRRSSLMFKNSLGLLGSWSIPMNCPGFSFGSGRSFLSVRLVSVSLPRSSAGSHYVNTIVCRLVVCKRRRMPLRFSPQWQIENVPGQILKDSSVRFSGKFGRSGVFRKKPWDSRAVITVPISVFWNGVRKTRL